MWYDSGTVFAPPLSIVEGLGASPHPGIVMLVGDVWTWSSGMWLVMFGKDDWGLWSLSTCIVMLVVWGKGSWTGCSFFKCTYCLY